MDLDSAMLSRIQFAFTISFHIIFPAITIGLATAIAIWEGLWLKTRNPVYFQLAKFWIKPFAITFGMGVVSGIVLSYVGPSPNGYRRPARVLVTSGCHRRWPRP